MPVQVGMNLFCQGCDVEGYAPFALANSSGIELFIETAVPQTGKGFVGKQRCNIRFASTWTTQSLGIRPWEASHIRLIGAGGGKRVQHRRWTLGVRPNEGVGWGGRGKGGKG